VHPRSAQSSAFAGRAGWLDLAASAARNFETVSAPGMQSTPSSCADERWPSAIAFCARHSKS
jgi:hypothetical protein